MSRTARFTIALTPHARQQLQAEMAWSRRRWGRRHQLVFRKGLLARLDAIAANPHTHALRPEVGAEVRLAHHGGLLIAYSIDTPARRIVVLAFPMSIASWAPAWRRPWMPIGWKPEVMGEERPVTWWASSLCQSNATCGIGAR